MASDSNSAPAAEASSSAQAAVFVKSAPVPSHFEQVRGPDFDQRQSLESLMTGYASVGFQASAIAKACNLVDKMRTWRLSDEPITADTPDDLLDPGIRQRTACSIFLGFTSNLVSSGLREVILFLVKHKLVSALVTTAGGIEEDLIKCLGPTYLGDFSLDGAELRRKGLNRIGNLLVPNDNYCKFEDWVMPILDKLREEQGDDLTNVWTPSRIIERLGREIDDERSILYWAARNGIPVFCPALTDGSLGDMLYFHSYKNPGLVVDLVGDIRRLNDLSVKAKKAGMIILGGGVCKHQIANAMLFRNGADYAVYINTGQEFDGSDSGARPDEAVSWGKIRIGGESVKIYADATIVFPLIIARTFGKAFWDSQTNAVGNRFAPAS
ncbi:deoxyhypusine synthase [Ceraceosorus bombacis]|uniref:deoxyhypusine synthase n=1 Tax=Ceraceosorus bombacis TaxID=401625 RepID=A0A0P1B982_9BASI|nr:deoxyhypusine synthase [Ceraceosorus bombacis]